MTASRARFVKSEPPVTPGCNLLFTLQPHSFQQCNPVCPSGLHTAPLRQVVVLAHSSCTRRHPWLLGEFASLPPPAHLSRRRLTCRRPCLPRGPSHFCTDLLAPAPPPPLPTPSSSPPPRTRAISASCCAAELDSDPLRSRSIRLAAREARKLRDHKYTLSNGQPLWLSTTARSRSKSFIEETILV